MRLSLPSCLLAISVFCSCASGESSPAEGGDPTETNVEKALENGKAEEKTSKGPYSADELNEPYSRVSPWRYIVTSPETQYFERMVGSSSLAKTIHSSGHTILVPEDATFTENREWKGILDEGQEQALDRYVKAHILKGVKGIKMLEGEYENLNGETVAIEKDAQGQLVCGGARLLGRAMETDRGIVIPVLGLVEGIQWN